MRDLGFHEKRSSRKHNAAAAAAAGDTRSDSVIFTLESNLSLFSSASASVDRCSFASAFVVRISPHHYKIQRFVDLFLVRISLFILQMFQFDFLSPFTYVQ
ncbi:hypothetical protein TSUD_307990 [Trifolium subterraneum]|nr:hypothetical protein TSUD_307990 [Trifolium subterraneum]